MSLSAAVNGGALTDDRFDGVISPRDGVHM